MCIVLSTWLDLTAPQGRIVASAIAIGGAAALAWIFPRLAARRIDDPYTRYYVRKASRYLLGFAALVAIALIWRAFAGKIAVVLGLAAAGIAFAMQEAIGSVAGWFNILSGRIFRVGDRIEMGGVRGDVIDITPLRTKILEMGSRTDDGSTWVHGRQYTGRIVAVSNKSVFEQPVFNYSAIFEFIWDELTVPVPHRSDWKQAERILVEEAERISNTEGARKAMSEMTRRYPIPRTEIEPRVYVRATDNYMELAARFVVPVRTARSLRSQMTRRVKERLDQAGIEVASTTEDVTVRIRGEDRAGDGRASSRSRDAERAR